MLEIEDGAIEVLATRGDIHLGGHDFDQLVVDYCVADFRENFDLDIRNNKRAMARLRIQCEKAKRILSMDHTAQIECESLFEDQDFELELTRAKFEQLCAPAFNSCFPLIE